MYKIVGYCTCVACLFVDEWSLFRTTLDKGDGVVSQVRPLLKGGGLSEHFSHLEQVK